MGVYFEGALEDLSATDAVFIDSVPLIILELVSVVVLVWIPYDGVKLKVR